MTIAHASSLGLDFDALGMDDGNILKTGGNQLLLSEAGRQFDAALITDAGNCFTAAAASQSANATEPTAGGSSTASASVVGTVPQLANYLAFTSPTSSLGHHFASGTITVNLSGLALAGELMYARAALAAWARVANITFLETSGPAQITFSDDGDNVNYTAYASTSWSGPTFLDSAEIHISQKWYNTNGGGGGAVNVLNGYGFQTYVHELGHALGLGHLGPYNGSATFGVDNVWTNDSYRYSTMSYFDQIESSSGASFSYITSAMMADIYAIQLLYGAPATNPGSHNFGYNANVGAMFDLAQSNSFCMYSVDGIANLDATLYGGTQTVNFNAGTWSSIKGLTNNVSLATNTHLTEYWGGSGTDTITLTNLYVNDSVDGNAGTDTVYVTYAFGSGYSVATGSTAANLTLQGTAGLDTLVDIEFIHFSDGATVATSSLVAPPISSLNDFDGDGKSDMLWRNAAGLVIEWAMNDRTVVSAGYIGGDANWSIVGIGDFNGDMKSDILWRNTSGIVIEWEMNGRTVLSSGVVSADPGWTIVGIGDFDGDKKSDLLWRNSSGAVVERTMNGRTVLSAGYIGGDLDWSISGIGDFNGDGKSDILWRNKSGAVLEWDMDGRNVLSSGIISTDPRWSIAGIGDFDGDGKSDLLWRNSTGSVVEWSMVGRTVASSGYIGGDLAWSIAGIGDFNGDGKSDIVWRHISGVVAEWDMNGRNVVSSGVVSTDPSWQFLNPLHG